MNNCPGPACDRPVANKKRGLCTGHAHQQWRGEALKPLLVRARMYSGFDLCPMRGCERTVATRGLCAPHASVAWRMSIHPEALPGLLNGACCVICSSTENLALDHDHSCCDGNFSCGDCLRGVVCQSCNSLLGAIDRAMAPEAAAAVAYARNPPGVTARRFTPVTIDSHPGRVEAA